MHATWVLSGLLLVMAQVSGYFKTHYKYDYTTYYHQVKEVSRNAEFIEIEDGSVWEIDPQYAKQLGSWKKREEVLVSPGNKKGQFFLTNVKRNMFIHGKLVRSPEKASHFTCWVSRINYDTGYVEVRNGQRQLIRWKSDPKDRANLELLREGEAVVMGTNDAWYNAWFGKYDAILVSVANYPSYVRVCLSD